MKLFHAARTHRFVTMDLPGSLRRPAAGITFVLSERAGSPKLRNATCFEIYSVCSYCCLSQELSAGPQRPPVNSSRPRQAICCQGLRLRMQHFGLQTLPPRSLTFAHRLRSLAVHYSSCGAVPAARSEPTNELEPVFPAICMLLQHANYQTSEKTHLGLLLASYLARATLAVASDRTGTPALRKRPKRVQYRRAIVQPLRFAVKRAEHK